MAISSFRWGEVGIVNTNNRLGLIYATHKSISCTFSPAVGILACKKGKGSKEQAPGVSSFSQHNLPVHHRSGSCHSSMLSLLFVCSHCILSGSGTLPVQRALKVPVRQDHLFNVYSSSAAPPPAPGTNQANRRNLPSCNGMLAVRTLYL